ncbi:hypothetical protein BD31_I1658, partial [Candidatus Nitrosopumilus salaria BD31]
YFIKQGNYTVFVQDGDTKDVIKSSNFQVTEVSTDTTLINTILIPGIVLPGAGAGITFLYSILSKKRDETKNELEKKKDDALAMSKYRMDRVNIKFNDYIDLMNYSNQIASYTNRFPQGDEINNVKLFLSLLKFSELDEKFVARGDLLLTDQDAEDVISQLSHALARKIFGIFQNEPDYWKFRDLNSSRSVARMLKLVKRPNSGYDEHFCSVINWFSNLCPKDKKSLESLAKSIDELLLYELNLVYDNWYPNKFSSGKFLSKETLDYVSKEHEFSKGRLDKAFPKYYEKLLYF